MGRSARTSARYVCVLWAPPDVPVPPPPLQHGDVPPGTRSRAIELMSVPRNFAPIGTRLWFCVNTVCQYRNAPTTVPVAGRHPNVTAAEQIGMLIVPTAIPGIPAAPPVDRRLTPATAYQWLTRMLVGTFSASAVDARPAGGQESRTRAAPT